jgi:hypothetical protein
MQLTLNGVALIIWTAACLGFWRMGYTAGKNAVRRYNRRERGIEAAQARHPSIQYAQKIR